MLVLKNHTLIVALAFKAVHKTITEIAWLTCACLIRCFGLFLKQKGAFHLTGMSNGPEINTVNGFCIISIYHLQIV